MADYFVINGLSGDVSVKKYTKKGLMAAIQEEDFGDPPDDLGFVTDLKAAGGGDPFAWGNRICIIRGELVEPKPKEQVTVWEV